MALAQPSAPDRQPSPALSLSALPSNNPFRNRAASPALSSPGIPPPRTATNERPVSKNPFLASFETESHTPTLDLPPPSPFWPPNNTTMAAPQKAAFGSEVEELIKGLSVDDTPKVATESKPRPPQRSDTLPTTNGHRPSRSDEERKHMQNGSRGPPRPRGPPGPFDSPPRRSGRARANSDTSVAEKHLHPDEDRRRRERERRRREADGKDKDGKPRSSRPSQRRKPHGLDLIDKLDVTGIYGSGPVFHHDGPFDACNPHRNRKKDGRAPMQAFPASSANMSMGGSGPVNSNIDLAQFHGRGAEGFTDYAATNARANSAAAEAFNPIQRIEPVHGEESYGLGTSTFLEGTPATRTAIQRRESEKDTLTQTGGGLGRKKSLAQRIRGMSQPRRDYGGARVYSPEGRFNDVPMSPESPPSKIPPTQALSAGGISKSNEANPFFNEYDDAYEKKGTSIKIAEDTKTGRPRAPSSPRIIGLERRKTADSAGELAPEPKAMGGGFLNRMRSMKGGKKPVRGPA